MNSSLEALLRSKMHFLKSFFFFWVRATYGENWGCLSLQETEIVTKINKSFSGRKFLEKKSTFTSFYDIFIFWPNFLFLGSVCSDSFSFPTFWLQFRRCRESVCGVLVCVRVSERACVSVCEYI